MTEYNGILNVTNKNRKLIFILVFEGADFKVNTIPPGAHEIESLHKEIERIIIDEGYITEEDYPFTIKANFSTLGSNIEITPGRGWQISFVQDIRSESFCELNRLSYTMDIFYPIIPLIDYPLIIFFLETDIAQGMISNG